MLESRNRTVLGLVVLAICAHLPAWGYAAEEKLKRPPGDDSEIIQAFGKRHRGKAAAREIERVEGWVAQELQSECGGEAAREYTRSLSEFGAWSPVDESERATRGSKKRKVRYPTHVVRGDACLGGPVDRDLYYAFAERALSSGETCDRVLAKLIDRGQAVEAADLSATSRLAHLLGGRPAAADLMLASIEQRLDVLDHWVEFGRLLSAWRYQTKAGEESFYEALDRTAGTEEELFYYDSMLADFVEYCAPRSLQRAGHSAQVEAIQRAFLSYRQYRGLIEAVAHALVLAPDEALPASLSRYDYTAGPYSVREVVDLLLEHNGGDVGAVIETVRTVLMDVEFTGGIDADFRPVPAFNAAFQAMIPAMVEKSHCSTDAMGERHRAWRAARARVISDAAWRAVESA